jgi:hypothetical protein
MALAGKDQRKRNMDKITIRALVTALFIGFLVFAPQSVLAQSQLEPTQIVVGVPTQATLGQPFTVQAVLADSKGHPISKAVIYFTAPATFLGATNNVVLAQAVTNKDGQVSAQIVDDLSGTITLNAEFQGDTQYAPSNATAKISAASEQQVYNDHIGVDIPGFNVPPVISGPQASLHSQSGIMRFIQNLWPAMNGWPVAAVLFIVWSMYLLAVRFVFRVAMSGNEPGDSTSTDSRR